jgi:hypothetical protein
MLKSRRHRLLEQTLGEEADPVAFGEAFQPSRFTLSAVAETQDHRAEYLLEIGVVVEPGERPVRVTQIVVRPTNTDGALPLGGIDRIPLSQLLRQVLMSGFRRGRSGGLVVDTWQDPGREAIDGALTSRPAADELSRELAEAYLAAKPKERVGAARTMLDSRGLHHLSDKAIRRRFDVARDKGYLKSAGQGRGSVAGPSLSRD